MLKFVLFSDSDSPAFTGGCWIGLLDKRGDGQFDWIEPKTVGAFVDGLPTPLFLDWRWNEPNNRTVSEGQVTAGERCTLVIPWQEDTLLLEQGSWNDVACSLKKPFVCQHYGESKQFSLTVSGTASVSGGQLTGAKLVFNSDSIIDDYQASMGAVLEIGAAGSDTTIGQLLTENGVILRINGNVNLVSSLPSGRSFIGEQYIRNISSDFVSSTSGTDSNLLMQSVVTISEGVIVGCSSSETIFNARLENQGIFQIQPNSNVFLLQVENTFS